MGIKKKSPAIKPYIFVSYAHSDQKLVMPVVDGLSEHYELWVDRMLVPKEIWDDTIAKKIESCSIMICFLTKSYCDSKFCMKELRFAKGQNREILPVFLEDVELPPGLKMHFSDEQFITYHTCADVTSLLREIKKCAYLEPCKREKAVEHPKSRLSKTDELSGKDRSSKSKKTVKSNKSNKNGKNKTKKGTPLGLTIFLFAMILVWFLIGGILSSIDGSPGSGKNEKTSSELPDDAAYVISLSDLDESGLAEYLHDGIPTSVIFTNTHFNLPEGFELVIPKHVENLSFVYCTDLPNIDSIQNLENLKTLEIVGCNLADDHLPAVLPSTLEEINLSHNGGLKSLAPLQNCTNLTTLDVSATAVLDYSDVPKEKLHTLNISGTQLTDLSQIAEFTELTHLYGISLPLTSLDPIAKLEKLVEIDFSNCGLETLNEDFMSLRLESITLEWNKLASLDAFKNCTILNKVFMANNQLTDIEVLKKSAKTLNYLDISDNPISVGELKQAFEVLTNIMYLNVTHLPLGEAASEPAAELEFLSPLKGLITLAATGCEISDLSALRNMDQLHFLFLTNNNLTNISGLSDQIDNSTDLFFVLNDNPISDWSGLPSGKYDKLYAYCPDGANMAFPPEFHVNKLVVSANADPENLAESAGTITELIVVDCPLDRRVAFEDSIGIDKVSFCTQAELAEMES